MKIQIQANNKMKERHFSYELHLSDEVMLKWVALVCGTVALTSIAKAFISAKD